MPGEAIQVGPFVGGLNTFSDPTAIADNELTVCENFELDLDGSLVSRPPIAYRSVTFPLGATGNVLVLGYFYSSTGVPYLLASDGLTSTYYFTGTAWSLITNTFAATAMTQFDGKAWLLAPPSSANPGGYWTNTGGFTASANMPKGTSIVSHKYRLWVAGSTTYPTRMFYSNILGDANFWPTTPNLADIGAGDGQVIVSLAVYYNSLIAFRTSSIYSFQYTTNASAATISVLVPNVGLTSKNAIVSWENYIYFLYDDKAYEFVNNRAQQINLKVPFESANRIGIDTPHAVSVFNNRILFSFWDTMYVFNIRTRTWTTWKSPTYGPLGKVTSAVVDNEYDTTSGAEKAILFSSAAVPSGGTRVAKTLHITDEVSTEAETFTCTAETKNYNYQASSVYKRLFWWGADAIFRSKVTATAIPVSFSSSVYWSDVASKTWANLSTFTWEQPFTPGLSQETVRNTSGTGAQRKFVKFLKALRFRQIRFKLVFETDGSLTTAPVRLFSLMTYVRAHERVSKTVT